MASHDRLTPVRSVLAVLVVLCGGSLALAQPATPGAPGTYQHMAYGAVIGQSIEAPWPEGNIAYKGMAIRLEHDAAVVFDTDLLRYAAGTAGGWVDILDTDYAAAKGHSIAATEGRLVFATAAGPGWADPHSGIFEDRREHGVGNLPREHAHYKGRYRHGDRVVLSYSVGESQVLEMPEARMIDGRLAFVRHMHVEQRYQSRLRKREEQPGDPERPRNFVRGHEALLLNVAEEDAVSGGGDLVVVRGPDRVLAVMLAGGSPAPVAVGESASGDGVTLLVAENAPAELAVSVAVVEFDAGVEDATIEAMADAFEIDASLDLPSLTQGGLAQWEEEVAVAGELGGDDWAYTVDTLTLPMENPWNARMRLMGFDFFEGGERAAVVTLNGDVWIVDGIDDSLEELRWRRYASGLFEPGGLTIVDDVVHVLERGQITRLHDLNGDGEADFYENFNNDQNVYPRGFWLTLETDSAGNFYFLKNGNRVPSDVPDHGALIRVSADGEKAEVYARGLRSANGLHITEDDVILVGDQEGEWTPATRVNYIERGGFYGHRPHGGEGREVGEYELPICWIPHPVDNSAGDAALAPADERFGPLAGHWLHTSYGKASLFVLMFEQRGGVRQGGVVKLPLFFQSGIMRARFNESDGQLYLTGMRGWQTVSFRDGAFYRVRYTGKPANLPVDVRVRADGVALGFTDPLDAESAADVANYTARRWTYVYSSAYGSPEVSLETPAELRAPAARRPDGLIDGRDEVSIADVTLSDDGRTVFLRIPDIEPVKQMMIEYDVVSAEGEPVRSAVYHTIHTVGEGVRADR